MKEASAEFYFFNSVLAKVEKFTLLWIYNVVLSKILRTARTISTVCLCLPISKIYVWEIDKMLVNSKFLFESKYLYTSDRSDHRLPVKKLTLKKKIDWFK